MMMMRRRKKRKRKRKRRGKSEGQIVVYDLGTFLGTRERES